MSTLVHADIFFFVTTVSVVLITLAVLVAAYYCVGILREVRSICTKIRKVSDDLENDFEELRAHVKTQGVKVRSVTDLVLGFLTHRLRVPRSRKKPESSEAQVD